MFSMVISELYGLTTVFELFCILSFVYKKPIHCFKKRKNHIWVPTLSITASGRGYDQLRKWF